MNRLSATFCMGLSPFLGPKDPGFHLPARIRVLFEVKLKLHKPRGIIINNNSIYNHREFIVIMDWVA